MNRKQLENRGFRFPKKMAREVAAEIALAAKETTAEAWDEDQIRDAVFQIFADVAQVPYSEVDEDDHLYQDYGLGPAVREWLALRYSDERAF